MSDLSTLSRRERQIMEVIFGRGEATVREIQEELPEAPTPMAIRRMMQILEEKGAVKRRKEGREFVYSPIGSREKASRGALENVLQTFFGGSIENLIASHFADPKSNHDPEALNAAASIKSGALRWLATSGEDVPRRPPPPPAEAV